MTRLAPFVLSALLSVLTTSVDAKSKGDQLRMYQWSSDHCHDMPKGANIDIKRNECANIGGRSFKARIDVKRQKWLDDVNEGNLQCVLAIFDAPNCPETKKPDSIMFLPQEIDDCYTSPTGYAVGSVMFMCGPVTVHDAITSTHTTTSTATTWSIGNDDNLTPVTQKKTLTSTTTIPKIISTSIGLAARGAEVRAKENIKHVWMKHPWSGSAICYECFTKNKDKFDWVKCYARPNEGHMCGQRPIGPGGEQLTTTTTAMTTTTTTVTDSVVRPGTLIITNTVVAPGEPPLQPRSWHKKVSFRSPWHSNLHMCADAEWEKRGKPNTEIRLQEVHLAQGNKHCDSNESIDLPEPMVHTASDIDISTDTATATGYTAMSTITTTIYTAVVVSTATVSGALGGISATKTYWPTQYEITTLDSTVITITTLVPVADTRTTYLPADVANDRADIPVHRDL